MRGDQSDGLTILVVDEAAFADASGRGRDLSPEASLALATMTLDEVVERDGSNHE